VTLSSHAFDWFTIRRSQSRSDLSRRTPSAMGLNDKDFALIAGRPGAKRHPTESQLSRNRTQMLKEDIVNLIFNVCVRVKLSVLNCPKCFCLHLSLTKQGEGPISPSHSRSSSKFQDLSSLNYSLHSRHECSHTVVCIASTVPTSTPTPSRLRHVHLP